MDRWRKGGKGRQIDRQRGEEREVGQRDGK
jgi:hypothetical protein